MLAGYITGRKTGASIHIESGEPPAATHVPADITHLEHSRSLMTVAAFFWVKTMLV
jgi:hypothetical protein